MTVQAVNLYSALFQEDVGFPSAIQAFQVIGLAAALVAAMGIYSALSTSSFQDEFDQLTLTRNDLMTSVADLRAQYGIKQRDETLANQTETLKQEQESKTILLSSLASGSQGSKGGFARHLRGLARRRVRGLWLTEIHVQQGGRQVSLNGLTMQPELVPKLLQLLRDEPAFKGQEYSSFSLNRTKGSTEIAFSLSSTPEDEESKR